MVKLDVDFHSQDDFFLTTEPYTLTKVLLLHIYTEALLIEVEIDKLYICSMGYPAGHVANLH